MTGHPDWNDTSPRPSPLVRAADQALLRIVAWCTAAMWPYHDSHETDSACFRRLYALQKAVLEERRALLDCDPGHASLHGLVLRYRSLHRHLQAGGDIPDRP
jgi:hypothetical protein